MKAYQLSFLFQKTFGEKPEQVELLPASGSARQYYRMLAGGKSYIGAWHENLAENRLFIRFSRHFRSKGLRVPEIYGISADEKAYIQEDLGHTMLLDAVEKDRKNGKLDAVAVELYRKALKELLRFQFIGTQGLDYTGCVPRPVFDRRCILWDLNYFKYCFLRLAGAAFSEESLENDFEQLAGALEQVKTDTFMFRDFQSRNIMVKDSEVWFIDYQGGRQGALHYDVASLLYDAIVRIPGVQREELLDFYIGELQVYRPAEAAAFRRHYYRFVLVRLLQAMGAFGLRGLYERKQHFIDSITPGLLSILELFGQGHLGKDYPEIRRVIETLVETKR